MAERVERCLIRKTADLHDTLREPPVGALRVKAVISFAEEIERLILPDLSLE